ncbi:MAG TPA: ATP-binding protein [Vicinamibacterales bacterium]|nr:ATP-binding protein [Vicinamibacterales bacterium]
MTLVDRLAALPNLSDIPRAELEWLAGHGRVEHYASGSVVAEKGQPVRKLWIILSGLMAVRVDRGAGPRIVMEWHVGEVSGMLPYSRMTGPPGDNYMKEAGEALAIGTDVFPEMVYRCPTFTAYTVHLMLDRARMFNTTEMQDEKMISLGRLSAGLAHELNNPASAIVRAAKLLNASLSEAEAAARSLGAAGLGEDALEAVEQVRTAAVERAAAADVSPLELADREERVADWLSRHGADQACASPLSEAAVDVDALDGLAAVLSGPALDAALREIAASVTLNLLACDIERAGTRISELVGAVKRFSYMDQLGGPEPVAIEGGIRDTMRVLASKARAKQATVTLKVDPELPRVQAIGGELNQVWMNLLDNALDAVGDKGQVEITATHELDHVVVRIADNGPGIPEDVRPRVFDAFFTTKPPGQGTGLGLDIVRRIVRMNRGDIVVESRPGRTEFKVSLLAMKG